MSKREGEFVTLDELIDDIGVDAARWFLLLAQPRHALDLDLELARERSPGQPRLLRAVRARADRVDPAQGGGGAGRPALAADLTRQRGAVPSRRRARWSSGCSSCPDEVREAAERRAPHRMTAYAHETAQDFSAFYRDCRVVGAAEEGGDEDVRIAICVLAKRVLAPSLDLLGVEAPESM